MHDLSKPKGQCGSTRLGGCFTFPPSQRNPWRSESLFTLISGEKLDLFTFLVLYPEESGLPEEQSRTRFADLNCCVFVLCVWRMSKKNMENGERTAGTTSKVPRWEE